MSEQMTVHKDGKAIYDIHFTTSFDQLSEVVEKCGYAGKRICIVSDSNVGPLYREQVRKMLSSVAKEVFDYEFIAGESSKNLDTVNELYLYLIENQFDRGDCLIALGGGVVGDLTGFAASTYLRGIAFIQVPTSLLAMVDSSIGGKTGVDYKGYKNMVGAFYQPKAVYMNFSVLTTLNDKQFYSGFGEIIKHGLIQDSNYYDMLLSTGDSVNSSNTEWLAKVIPMSCQIKRKVVEEDPTEKGLRAILNFGHTIGHAIEKKRYQTYLHGECVALGVVAAGYISMKRGLINEQQLAQIEECLQNFHLPIREVAGSIDVDEIISITKNDKKMCEGKIKFVLLRSIGEAYIDMTVTEEEMKQAVEYILQGEK